MSCKAQEKGTRVEIYGSAESRHCTARSGVRHLPKDATFVSSSVKEGAAVVSELLALTAELIASAL